VAPDASLPEIESALRSVFAKPVVDVSNEVGTARPVDHGQGQSVLRGLATSEHLRESEPKSPFIFTSERGLPFTTAGFARMMERAGEAAELGFKAHPHC
jgi:hypothetical protein